MLRRTRPGFTLIEILVVVAIIALLVAVLLPSLASARDQAMTVMCKTRMRELYNGHAYYGQDNKQRFPHFDWWLWDGASFNSEPQYLKNASSPQAFYSRTGGVRPTDSTRWVEFGQIYRYIKNKDTYFCPKDTKRRSATDGGYTIGGGKANDGTYLGNQPIHSYTRFIDPHAAAKGHAKGTIPSKSNPDDGSIDPWDFLRPDDISARCWEPEINNDAKLPVPVTTSNDRIALLMEEWMAADANVVAPTSARATAGGDALNDGNSGFLFYPNVVANRHRKKCNLLYWDGHAALIDADRFNAFPWGSSAGDMYAATMAMGAKK